MANVNHVDGMDMKENMMDGVHDIDRRDNMDNMDSMNVMFGNRQHGMFQPVPTCCKSLS